jgi:hypothetical protein
MLTKEQICDILEAIQGHEKHEEIYTRIEDVMFKEIELSGYLLVRAILEDDVDTMLRAFTGWDIEALLERANIIPAKSQSWITLEQDPADLIFPETPLPHEDSVSKEDNAEWFGQVRWSEDDIANALDRNHYTPSPEAIAIIRKECEHHNFTDRQIECGWDVIDTYISDHTAELLALEAQEV